MFSNHSTNPNIAYRYTKQQKIAYTTRDVKAGDEILQDYCEFSNVKWYSDYVTELGETWSKPFAENLKNMETNTVANSNEQYTV